MNNRKSSKTKVILIVMAVAGLILFCFGTIMGGGITSITNSLQSEPLPDGAVPLSEVSKNDITSLELKLIHSDITIKTGKVFDVSGSGTYDSYVKDGVLYAGATSRKYYADFLGLKLYIPSKWICGHSSYIITLPDKSALTDLTIDTSFCDIEGGDLQVENISIENQFGDSEFASITADNLTANIKYGDFSSDIIQIAGRADLQISGDVSLGTDDREAQSIIQNMMLRSNRGDIEFTGSLRGSNTLTAAHGEIEAVLTGSPGNYTINRPDNMSLQTGIAAPEESGTEELLGNIAFDCKKGSVRFHLPEKQ